MSDAIERFNLRKGLGGNESGAEKSAPATHPVQPCDTALATILSDRINDGHPSPQADPEALLADIRGKLDSEKFAALIDSCQRECLEAVIRPFGLGRVLFEDKDGGNVTTIHNARSQSVDNKGRQRYIDRFGNEYAKDGKGNIIAVSVAPGGAALPSEIKQHNLIAVPVFATTGEEAEFKNFIKMSGDVAAKCREEDAYLAKREALDELKNSGNLLKTFGEGSFDSSDKIELDHLIPCISIARDGGVFIAGVPVSDLANMDANLNPLTQYANRSKKEKSVEATISMWAKNEKAIEKLERISGTAALTEKQSDALRKLYEIRDINKDKMLAIATHVRAGLFNADQIAL